MLLYNILTRVSLQNFSINLHFNSRLITSQALNTVFKVSLIILFLTWCFISCSCQCCTIRLSVMPPFFSPPSSDTKQNIYSLKEHMIGKYLIAMGITGLVSLLFIFFWENTFWKLRMLTHQHIYFGVCKKYKTVST